MNDTFDIRGSELHIEVHKFRAGSIILATAFALVLQAFLPIYFPKAAILDLPLLITIYFGLSRRNPSTGLLLGMAIGILQDSLSGPTVPLGLYGIAKTVIGYLASSIGARLDTEHPAARFALTIAFFRRPPRHNRFDAPPAPFAARALVHSSSRHRRARQRRRRRLPLPAPRPPPQTFLAVIGLTRIL